MLPSCASNYKEKLAAQARPWEGKLAEALPAVNWGEMLSHYTMWGLVHMSETDSVEPPPETKRMNALRKRIEEAKEQDVPSSVVAPWYRELEELEAAQLRDQIKKQREREAEKAAAAAKR